MDGENRENHAASYRLTTCCCGNPGGSTRRFRVHAGEGHSFLRYFVDVGRLIARNIIEHLVTDCPVFHIIPHDVDDIRGFAKFLAKFSKLFINDFVFSSPFFTILGLKDWILGIMNNIRWFFSQSISGKQ